MEVIQLDDDDDDFIQSVNPTAIRKSSSQQAAASSSKDTRVSKRPPPISTRIDSDPLLKSSASSLTAPDDECPICGRDLRLLNEQRRTLHLNSCLDDGEAKADLDKNMEKWKSTMDCPVCKTPLAAGPFRSAHIKKCGREHAINGRDLLNLVNTQEKVADSRRKRALPHTSAKTPKLRPKKVSKLDGEPKSLAEEEMIMAKALSASMMDPIDAEIEEERRKKEERAKREEEEKKKLTEGVSPQFTRIINDNIRKRRSYAVVELAPRGCKCDVIEIIQSRFLQVFRARKVLRKNRKKEENKGKKGDKEQTNDNKEEKQGEEQKQVKESLADGEKGTVRRVQMEAAMGNTLARLDSLSWAYRKMAVEGEQKGDVHIECRDGQMRAFSWALFARTTALGRVVEENAKISIDQPTTVVRHWLQYVHCAQIEWATGEENDGVREIAKQHGPEGLVEECARMAKTRREYHGFGRIGAVTEQDTVSAVPSKVATGEATLSPVDSPEEEPEVVPLEEEALLPCDDAIEEEANRGKNQKEQEGTLDSEGSMTDALRKCAAGGRGGARLSTPRPLDSSFLAALAAPPIVDIPVATPTTVSPRPPPKETPKDSFLDSIVFGETPERREQEEATIATALSPVIAVPTVPQPTDDSMESMDESDAMRNILDVSCLRRSPMIRVEREKEKEYKEGMPENGLSPELFGDSDDNENEQREEGEMSQRVPSPPRRSPRRSASQSILVDTITPTTSRTARARKSILGLKKLQEIIYLDDTPLSSPVASVPKSTVTIMEKKEEERTVDESFPREDLPSYGQGGLDTVDAAESMEVGGGEQANGDDPMADAGGDDFHYDHNDYDYFWEGHDWNNDEEMEMGGEGGEEVDPSVSARAQEEVDSFLQSLRFNQSKEKTASTSSNARPPEDSFLKSLRFNESMERTGSPAKSAEEVDSFLVSMRMMGGDKETEDSGDGSGDILDALSPVRKESENVFKTPTVRGGRGRGGRGTRGRGTVFGSHVKVLKWSNVTPKPRFEAMDDAALKAQLARYGLRPMGRKRAIAMLSEIYEQTHPVVDESEAATAGPSATSTSSTTAAVTARGRGDISPAKRWTVTMGDEEEDEDEYDGEKTLNRGVYSSDDEDDSERGGGVGEAEESMIIPKGSLKGVDNQLVLFLEWLRSPPQKDLYDHCLALKSLSLEELEVKLKRADSALCGISRKVLMCVLDRLHITYSLPQEGWTKKKKNIWKGANKPRSL